MPTLRELQMQFASALFDGVFEPIAAHICANGIDPAARLRVYRNNVREGFINTLALEFPVICKLVGTECFRQLALELHAAHPSRAGNIHHIGAPFPQFLRTRFANSEYEYFADVAALEWAYQESLVEADTEPFDVEGLRAVDPDDYPELRFKPHPACRLVRSSYPIVRIWAANQDGAPDEHIDLNSGADNVLVHRVAGEIEFHRLTAGEFAFLDAFARGATLGAALDQVQTLDSAFDTGAALRRFVGLGVLTLEGLPP